MISDWISRISLGAILAFTVNIAAAHEIRPAIVTAVFAPEQRYEITVVANLEALLAGIGPVHADTNEFPKRQSL